MLGDKGAPYFGPVYEYPKEARSLWEGYRGIEEYAREVFPVEEAANGLTWMDEPGNDEQATDAAGDDDEGDDGDDDEDDDNNTDTGTTGTRTPLVMSGVRTAWAHPEKEEDDFFVGSC